MTLSQRVYFKLLEDTETTLVGYLKDFFTTEDITNIEYFRYNADPKLTKLAVFTEAPEKIVTMAMIKVGVSAGNKFSESGLGQHHSELEEDGIYYHRYTGYLQVNVALKITCVDRLMTRQLVDLVVVPFTVTQYKEYLATTLGIVQLDSPGISNLSLEALTKDLSAGVITLTFPVRVAWYVDVGAAASILSQVVFETTINNT